MPLYGTSDVIYSQSLRLWIFFSECRRFVSTRRLWEDFVGLVFLRGFGGTATDRIICLNFSKQSFMFMGRSRCRSLVINKSPSWVNRDWKCRKQRSRTSSGKDGEYNTLNLKRALELTLLTFCPPLPELRAKLHCSSKAGMWIFSVTTNIRTY